MGVSSAQLKRIVDMAHVLEQEGYFERARGGDQRATSLFVRLVAVRLNPLGVSTDVGWLSKSPGESQVDGYAEDAICGNDDPSDLANVIDLVKSAGAPNASIDGSVKERRIRNFWMKPHPLLQAEMDYLLAGGVPIPIPRPCPQPPPRDEALDEQRWLHAYYKSAEGLQRMNGLWRDDTNPPGPDFEGISAWYLDVYQRARMAGKSRADARAAYVSDIRHSDEWKQKHPGETP